MIAYARSVFRISCAVIVAMILYVALTFVDIWFAGNYDNGKTADAIVVMGAAQYDGVPSPLLESRLQTALSLWREKRAPVIALTGGKQDGDRFTEAEAGKRWLVQQGVPAASIEMETVGQSTWQSVEALVPVLQGADIDNVLVVSSDWHIGRTAATLREVGFSVAGSASPRSGDGWDFYEWTRETVGVSIGRIIGFNQLFSISG